MSTRKLILVALVCGLVILVAGGVQLALLAGRDDDTEATVLAPGEIARLDGIDVTVEGSSRRGDQLDVRVRYDAAAQEVANAADGWFVLGGGDVLAPLRADRPGACDGQSVGEGAGLQCSLSFATDAGTVTVGYGRPGASALWRVGE